MGKRKTLEDCHELARKRGGKCLSREYVSAKTKMEWKCSDPDHDPFLNTYDAINSKGRWCAECAGNKPKTLEDAHKLAARHNGKCLSEKYENAKTKMEWKCDNPEHESFLMRYDHVQQGSWCRKCSDERLAEKQRNTIEDAQKLVKENMGKCLSKEYINNYTKLEWDCDNPDHEPFWMVSNNVKNGQWCPQCKVRKTQNILTDCFKNIYSGYNIFCNYRGFEWLVNQHTNFKLEIDIFIKDIKLAIEYDGKQHFKSIKHKTVGCLVQRHQHSAKRIHVHACICKAGRLGKERKRPQIFFGCY